MAVKTKPDMTPAQVAPPVNGAAGHRAVMPPAGPQLRRRERPRRGLIATGVVVVLVAVLGAALVYQHQGGKVSVIKVAKAVPAGHKIEPGDLTTAQMASDDIPAFAGNHMDEVYGKVAAVGLVPGEVLNAAMVTSKPATPAGYVVAGVALKAGQLPAGGVSAGDQVMVILLPAQSSTASSAGSATVLESSVQVTDSATTADGTGSIVSLLIPKADAAQLAQANNAGLVSLSQVPAS
ncbi:MAG: hypothetical protein J0H43_14330 [Actinobacteria bacterium]|nr:hypothetical protein [Actinomycetota bacterium]